MFLLWLLISFSVVKKENIFNFFLKIGLKKNKTGISSEFLKETMFAHKKRDTRMCGFVDIYHKIGKNSNFERQPEEHFLAVSSPYFQHSI